VDYVELRIAASAGLSHDDCSCIRENEVLIISPQITWRDVPRSEAVEADIVAKLEKLDQFYEHIVSCRVLVESAHRHHHKGNLYRIRVEIEVPGSEIVATRSQGDEHAHEDIYVAIRDAFDAARRQLQDYARKRRGQVKHHDEHHSGRVRFTRPDDDYGFLETEDGREIYFHRNALINAKFSQLKEGTEVTFVEEQGREGPQAKQLSLGRDRGEKS
jgi:ribosomal subunit interface protein